MNKSAFACPSNSPSRSAIPRSPRCCRLTTKARVMRFWNRVAEAASNKGHDATVDVYAKTDVATAVSAPAQLSLRDVDPIIEPTLAATDPSALRARRMNVRTGRPTVHSRRTAPNSGRVGAAVGSAFQH